MRTLLVSILLAPLLHAGMRAPLTPAERTNGTETLSLVEPLGTQTAAVTACIVNKDGKQQTTATWVGDDGYLLTKASDAPRLEDCRVRWAEGMEAMIREIRRDPVHDLVLAQAVGVTGVTAVEFESAPAPTYGQWLVAPAKGGKEFRIGVLSAQRRRIPGMGAAIGVRMDERSADGKGVRIIGIAEDSPAAAAGLRANDVMLELAGEQLSEYKRVHEIISKRQPGEEIEVRFRRDGKENRVQVRLASRTKILQNWDGEDFANGGISVRTDNFPQVLQHDLPLGTRDMGGPLVDLQGRALGINISRVDRVTTFALPADVFWPTVRSWIETDRHPPKALRP